MRITVAEKLENGRLRSGLWGSTPADKLMGAFLIMGPSGAQLAIISTGPTPEDHAWEHVSVSIKHRTPNWAEMSYVKDLFWGDDECVVQFHPPKSVYVNYHPFCLHLWKSIAHEIPVPPAHLIGPIDKQRAAPAS